MLQFSVLPGTSTHRAMQEDGLIPDMTEMSQPSTRVPSPRRLTVRRRGFRAVAAVALVCAALAGCTGEQFQKGYILPPGALERREGLEQMLAASGTRLSVRQATLALGMLLQPAMAQGAAKLNKVLCLPLVKDVAMRGAVASWWLSLIMGFFSRHQVELGLFLTTLDGCPHLVLGFQGASAATLHAVLDQALLQEQGVSLLDAEWVEDEVDADYGLRKLSNYLRDPGLSLAQALSTYREVFLGV